MKLPAIFFLCAFALLFNACQRQPVSVLASIEPEQYKEIAKAKSGEAAKPAHQAETGPAPKFFPEKK